MGDNGGMTLTTPAVPARPGAVLPPLRIGPLTVDTPVVLAPMAGVTNAAFRRLCRESGAGLYVAEMVTSRALVERDAGVDADHLARRPTSGRARCRSTASTRRRSAPRCGCIAERGPRRPRRPQLRLPGAQGDAHGRGSGAALEAGPVPRRSYAPPSTPRRPYGVPVTVKMRKGIDDDHLTYLEAGLVAQEVGVAAVALHARTAADYYSGHGRLGRDRAAQGDGDRHPGARQRRHLVRRGRPARWSRRPAATASSSAAAARAGRGCSPTSPPRSPGPTSASRPGLG